MSNADAPGSSEGEGPRARFIVRGQRVAGEKKTRARELRREMTPAARALWELVRGNRLGFHIRREQLIDGYVADFYCHAAALVIEVDGIVHDDQAEYDERRTAAFAPRGIYVMRFRNEEVLTDPAAVAARIATACTDRVAPSPPLLRGEGAGG